MLGYCIIHLCGTARVILCALETAGLVEAINFAAFTPSIGNIVELGEKWYVAGGTQAAIQAITTRIRMCPLRILPVTTVCAGLPQRPRCRLQLPPPLLPLGLSPLAVLDGGRVLLQDGLCGRFGQVSQSSSEVASSLTGYRYQRQHHGKRPCAAAGQVGYIVYMTIQGGGQVTSSGFLSLARIAL